MLIYKLPFILQGFINFVFVNWMKNRSHWWIFLAAWKIIRSWLPPEADQFIKFVDAKSITEFVSVDQLSTSMGGTVSKKEIEPITWWY